MRAFGRALASLGSNTHCILVILGAICNKLDCAGAVALVGVFIVLAGIAYALSFVTGCSGAISFAVLDGEMQHARRQGRANQVKA